MTYKRLIIALSIILAAISCSKEGSKVVYLTVSPTDLNAPFTVSSQDVEIQSNGSWTIKVLSPDGDEVSWAKPNRVKGDGDSRISIRVSKNEYKEDRSARIAVLSETGDTATISLIQAGNPDSESSVTEFTLRIGIYNLKVVKNSDTGENAWDKRKLRLTQSIYDNEFDVFGVNECNNKMKEFIKSELAQDYNIKFFSPYSQDGEGDDAQGLLYRKSFTLLDWHYFWLSETPDIMAANDPNGATTYNRGGCCGTLEHKPTGIKFFVMVTHGAKNQSVRDEFADVYIDMEKKYNPNGYPSFFVGDMNARPGQSSVKTYLTYWKDVYLEVSSENRIGPFSTYNGFDASLNLNTDPRRIDYIFYRNAIPLNYVCNDKKYGGCYASDHLPVYSDLKITSAAE